jgi:ZIP family zinc transporter
MIESIFFALVAVAGLPAGEVAARALRPPVAIASLAPVFAAGVLVSAFGFELDEKAYELGGGAAAVLGLVGGAVLFTYARVVADRRGGETAWPAILACIPPSIAIAITQVEDGDIGGAIVAAVFLANFAVAAAGGSVAPRRWPALVAAAAVSAAVTYLALENAPDTVVAVTQGAAIGAVLCIALGGLASRAGAAPAGLAATLGFGLGFALSIA